MTPLKALYRKDRRIFLLTCLLFSVKEITYVTLLYRIGKIADFAIQGELGNILRYSGLTLLLVLLMYVFDFASQKARAAFLTGGMVSLEERFMKNILLRPLPVFRGKEDAYYLNLFSTDLKMYCDDYLDHFADLCGSAASLIVAVAILCRINLWLVVTAAVITGVSLASSQLFTAPVEKRRKRFSDASERFAGVLRETMEGYEIIHADRRNKDAAYTRFHDAGEKKLYEHKHYRKAYIVGAQSGASLSSLMGVLGTIFCAWLLLKGRLTVGLLLVVSNYFAEIAGKVGAALQYFLSIRSTRQLREKLAAEKETENLASDRLDGGALACGPAPMVEYQQVSFSFGERQLYHDMSCRFRPGGCYAIVGESGSGKSTLTKLLLKYYEDYTGTIRLAGQDIRQLSELEIYGLVGVVGQSPYLFNASLYENITMFSGTPGKDSEEYRQLLQELNLTELAARAGDQPLGDLGDKLSGGERQRIHMARTLRKRPPVMIFDEPVSGLDPENARLIQEFIFRRSDMTRIVITHDWSEEYLNRFDDVIPVGKTAMERRNPA